MTHINAPLTPTGRLRMVFRHLEDGNPKAHVAAEFRVSRPTVATWVARYLDEGEAGLLVRSSAPHNSRTRTPAPVVEIIESLRRERKWSARRIHRHLLGLGDELHLRTVGRWLHRLGISRLRDLTPDGDDLRRLSRWIRAAWPGHMVHLDVKKIGKIPDGGWRVYGRGSAAAKKSKRGPGARIGYTYLHSAVDGFSRLAYTEALEGERAMRTVGFFCRARAFFVAHGIHRLHRVVTDNGANYKARDFTRTVTCPVTRQAAAPAPGIPRVPEAGRPGLPGGELHLVMDNYAVHKTPEVKAWLAENPRFQVHFTPTSASWLNLVEVWFGIIARQALHRADVASVPELNRKIRAFVTGWNDRCHPFVWTKTSTEILKKANRPTTSKTGQ